MKNRIVLTVTVLVAIFFASGLQAEDYPQPAAPGFHARAYAEVGSGGGAYRTPRVRLMIEPRYCWAKVCANAMTSVIPTGKADTRDGITVSQRVELAYKLTDSIRAGGGGSYSYTRTSLYSKTGWHPYAVVSFDPDTDMTTSLRYFFPQGDRRNGLTGVELLSDFQLKGRLGLRFFGEIYSIYPTDAPQLGRRVITSGGGGITWRIR
jgi:hypothetical protein